MFGLFSKNSESDYSNIESYRQRIKELEAQVRSLEIQLLEAGIRPSSQPYEVDKEVIDLVRAGKKIDAIKQYRETRDISLREAKEVIDELSLKYEK